MSRDVVAVPERAVWLRVNGLGVATWTCTPLHLEELAVGRLVADGYIGSADDIVALRTLPEERGILGIDAEVPAARMATAVEEGEHRARHGCGPRFLLDCRPDLLRRPGVTAAAPPESGAFHGLFRDLFASATVYRATGGLHTAALSDGSVLDYHHEEVSRHNAVHKAIGEAVLERRAIGALGLITTARISGQIAASAARAGVAWIASRSVPTTLAVEIASLAGMPIIARAPTPDARVFEPEAA